MKDAPRFTDAPPLHRNLLLGSAQLLFWFLFHPAAWRNHLNRIAPDLRPHFCLAELRWRHWRNPSIWRLGVMTYLGWTLAISFLIVLILLIIGTAVPFVVAGVITGIAVGIIASLAASVVGSFAVGTAVGMAVALVVGVAGVLAFGTPNSLLVSSTAYTFPFILTLIIGLAGGLAGGLGFSVAAGIAGSAAGLGATTSLARQSSGVIIGVTIGLLTGFLTGIASDRFAIALAVGLPFGLAMLSRSGRWWQSLILGALVGLGGSLVGNLRDLGTAASVLEMIAIIALTTSLFTLPYVLAERIAGPWAGALAGALGASGGSLLLVASQQSLWPVLLASLTGILLGLALVWWRPVVMYPFLSAWNLLLLRIDERRLPGNGRSLFRLHSAFWDEFQRLPLVGLDTHLLLVLSHRPTVGEAALTYLSGSRQRWAAQAAQIELDARQLAACADVEAIRRAHRRLGAGELAGPASALLRSFSRVSQDVDAALQQESAYNRRLALSAAEDRLDGLLRELTRSNERYAARFRPVAADWRQIVSRRAQRMAAEAELRQEIDSPYIIGVPLTQQQEIFIGRTDISSRIEQLVLDRRQPPLLLYGQRRVGKTSLLNNLGRLLPSTIVPLFVDLQGPASHAPDEAGFLYNVARGMRRSARRQREIELPPLSRDELSRDPFTRFDEWLDGVEETLAPHLALLMLDEFEVLATALDKGRYDEETIMGMLRHLIQHRARFKVLLSGSHTLDEFQRWSSYLINVQVIHIGYLQEPEARQLIEHPVNEFALRYRPAAAERALALTRGHPFLVQLLCAEIVALKNEHPPAGRRLATVKDVETAVAPALEHGSFFFADVEQNQVDEVGLAVLRLLAAQGEGRPATRQQLVDYVPSLMALEESLIRLKQRELIEQVDGGYRFQVELVRRWFAERP